MLKYKYYCPVNIQQPLEIISSSFSLALNANALFIEQKISYVQINEIENKENDQKPILDKSESKKKKIKRD